MHHISRCVGTRNVLELGSHFYLMMTLLVMLLKGQGFPRGFRNGRVCTVRQLNNIISFFRTIFFNTEYWCLILWPVLCEEVMFNKIRPIVINSVFQNLSVSGTTLLQTYTSLGRTFLGPLKIHREGCHYRKKKSHNFPEFAQAFDFTFRVAGYCPPPTHLE